MTSNDKEGPSDNLANLNGTHGKVCTVKCVGCIMARIRAGVGCGRIILPANGGCVNETATHHRSLTTAVGRWVADCNYWCDKRGQGLLVVSARSSPSAGRAGGARRGAAAGAGGTAGARARRAGGQPGR